jgi:hypothetical protein
MAANLAVHYPVIALMDSTDTTPFTDDNPEAAGQTFPIGVPVALGTGGTAGYTVVWPGTNTGFLGFSRTIGQNLATNGAGAPLPFGQITGKGATQTLPGPTTQPSGVNIALGAWIADGRTLFEVANSLTVFEIQCDNSAGAAPADYTPTQANVGSQFGITMDASNVSCYLDLGKTTPGTNTVAELIGLSPVDGSIVNARVRIQILRAYQQLSL